MQIGGATLGMDDMLWQITSRLYQLVDRLKDIALIQ